MKQAILKKLYNGKPLTIKQREYAEKILGRFDEGCDLCRVNLLVYYGLSLKDAINIENSSKV